jgi:hypothetical protein
MTATAQDVPTAREQWYALAIDDVQLFACLLRLRTWEQREAPLSQLPKDLHAALLRKLDELVTDASRTARDDRYTQDFNSAIWNFMKPWQRGEAPVYNPKPAGVTAPC